MKLVPLLAATLLMSGCIYLTPATGIRVGNHANEFPQTAGSDGASQADPLGLVTGDIGEYRAGDFSVPFPDSWKLLLPREVPSSDGQLIERLTVGNFTQDGNIARLQVITQLNPLSTDPAKNLDLLRVRTEAIAEGLFKPGYKLTEATAPQKLAEETGAGFELAGTLVDAPNESGQLVPGLPHHVVARCVWHQGRGYMAILLAPESEWTAIQQFYGAILDHFIFTEVPLQLCPVPDASATQGAKPDAGATADAAATADLAATYYLCFPATGAASPAATAKP